MHKLLKALIIAIIIISCILLVLFIFVKIVNNTYHKKWDKRMDKLSFVKIGIDTTQLKELVGQPDYKDGDLWLYNERTFFGINDIVIIRLSKAKVISYEKDKF